MQSNEARLGHFLQSVRGGALAFACLRVRDEEVAQDLLQEAMIGFVASAQKYDEEIWKNLLYKILGRRIADWQRKQIWRNRIARIVPFSRLSTNDDEENELVEFSAGDEEGPEQGHRAEQLAQHFEGALSLLPARQQEAYLLRQWQAFSVSDTATIMKCSEGSVKTHLSRAMQALREHLGEWIDED